MKGLFPTPATIRRCSALVIAALGLWRASSAGAQTVTFDFDTGTPALTTGQNVPLDQTSGGVTAHFSAASGGISIQNALSTSLTLSRFSGNYTYPNSTGGVLVIQFSQEITNLAMNFATAEQTPIENPTPIQLIAYKNSTATPPVGSTITNGAYIDFNSLPMGMLTFSSATPFNVVSINIQSGGATGFLLDNIAIKVSGGDRYTITTSASPAKGGTTTGDGAYLSGAPVTVVAAPNPDYAFVNWTENGIEVSTTATYDFTAAAFRALVANFVATWTITTSASPAAGGATSGDGIYPGGSSITIGATPNPGYAFVNWTENEAPVSTWVNCVLTVSTNRTLVAHFAPACTITTSSSSASAGFTSGDGVYAIGAAVTVIATPRTGYAAANWTENGVPVSTAAAYSFTAGGNRALAANFTPNSANATFDFDTGTPALTNGQTTAFDQVSGGLTAHFNSTNDPAFSVQSDASTGWTLSIFSSNYLAPNVTTGVLNIEFSQWLTTISLTFATLDFQEIVIPSVIQLAAYESSTATSPLGTATAQGTYQAGDSMPMGAITFDSATPFRVVKITMPPAPQAATDFMIDNVAVVTVPQPNLAIFLTATNTAVVSWPAPAPGFVLQGNSDLEAAAKWTDTTNRVEVVGGQNQVILSSPTGISFYRLLRR